MKLTLLNSGPKLGSIKSFPLTQQLDRSQETGGAPEAAHGRSDLQKDLAEVLRHRAALSEVLRAIASSPHDLQPIFETILDSTRRLCRADAGALRLVEEAGLRLVAHKMGRQC